MALMTRSTDTILLMLFDLFFIGGESYRLKVLLHILYSLLTYSIQFINFFFFLIKFFFPCDMENTML